MSSFVHQFSEKLLAKNFMKYLANCCRTINSNDLSKESYEILQNLIKNYKNYHKDYNNDPILLQSLVF